jgi:hypothetical protein
MRSAAWLAPGARYPGAGAGTAVRFGGRGGGHGGPLRRARDAGRRFRFGGRVTRQRGSAPAGRGAQQRGSAGGRKRAT